MSEVHVVVAGNIVHNPSVTPSNANAQPIVSSGTKATNNAAVKGNVPGGSVVIGNPA